MMGASGSSEREEESSGQDVLDALHQLAGDLGLRVELSLDEAGDGREGQTTTGDTDGGSDDDRGVGEAGEREEEEGESGDDDDDMEVGRLSTLHLLGRLFGDRQ